DMVNKALKPLLEKKGYTVKVTEFSDYIQPNKALNSGELDANLFQHKIYMKKFAEQNGMDLTALVPVPTAPMGLYSDKVKDLKDLPEGAEVTLPNDPSNAARAYALLAAADLIKIKPNTDVLKITKNDVVENPKKLKFTELEAGQLARSLSSTTLAAVPGNFALAAKFDLTKALILEKMNENNRNNVVVTTANKDKQFAKDLVEIVQSKEFDEIINKDFKGFDKPGK
ncbi:MAG: MetQ/NlpA family ABC transporter substrate-binding protein, partial [Gemella haemolysans]|nr:MetQ/NlpA family ABC transporter substrate-binding protein [Gemella haemolysans]